MKTFLRHKEKKEKLKSEEILDTKKQKDVIEETKLQNKVIEQYHKDTVSKLKRKQIQKQHHRQKQNIYPANNYVFKVNRNTRKRCESYC